MLIASANQKGGVGKSTVIRNLALMRAAAGYKVAIIDADDDQNTLDKWYTRREDFKMIENADYNGRLIMITEDSDLLSGAIGQAKKLGCDTIMVDLPGRAVTPMAEMLLKADHCLCPLSASSDDYDVLPYMGKLLVKAKKYNEDVKLLVIHNKSNSNEKRRKLEREDLDYQCSQAEGLDLLTIDFRSAVAFQDAAKYGLALFEYAKLKASGLTDKSHNIVAFYQLYQLLWKEKWISFKEESLLESKEEELVEEV